MQSYSYTRKLSAHCQLTISNVRSEWIWPLAGAPPLALAVSVVVGIIRQGTLAIQVAVSVVEGGAVHLAAQKKERNKAISKALNEER